jgi:hypothetical protein
MQRASKPIWTASMLLAWWLVGAAPTPRPTMMGAREIR